MDKLIKGTFIKVFTTKERFYEKYDIFSHDDKKYFITEKPVKVGEEYWLRVRSLDDMSSEEIVEDTHYVENAFAELYGHNI